MILPNDDHAPSSPPHQPFKSDAEMWKTAFFLLDRLANKYPELQREFNIQWQLKYELPFGGAQGMNN